MDLPWDLHEDNEALHQDTPLYMTWFALGHAAVLLYLAFHALTILTPIERVLIGGSIALAVLLLGLLLRSKLRTALALAETVSPGAGRLAAEAASARFAAEAQN